MPGYVDVQGQTIIDAFTEHYDAFMTVLAICGSYSAAAQIAFEKTGDVNARNAEATIDNANRIIGELVSQNVDRSREQIASDVQGRFVLLFSTCETEA